MKTILLGIAVSLAAGLFAAEPPAPAAAASYENNFEQAALDKVPEDLMVLEGAWAVKAEAGNRFLELPGAPLDTFGVLFGSPVGENAAVSARVFATNYRRRFPAFGLGLNGAGGFRVVASPAKNRLELFKGEDRLADAAWTWESGTWTQLRLQVRKTGAQEWTVEAKAWKQGTPEPASWLITHIEKTAPLTGKATLWGFPFSGTPLRFDDLRVSAAGR